MKFDRYAEDYDLALAQGISFSGENKDYFARGRIRWLSSCLKDRKEQPQSIMDFGCGTGSSSVCFFELLGAASVIGIDTSEKLLEVANQRYGSERAQFFSRNHYAPSEQIDLAYCNGVFHHIPIVERETALAYIHRSLRPGGFFALWENNPWNPGTRYSMSRCPFDDDAITLTASETRRLLCRAKFEILRTDFLFIFPRMLSWCRGIEPLLSRLPVGAQYQVLCRRL
jgi:SAM-dependent methyltransferase